MIVDNDTMNNDYYSDGDMKPKSKIGKIFRWIGILLILLVYLLLMFRIFIKGDPKSAKQFLWTSDTVAAYERDPSSFNVYTQKIQSFSYPTGEKDKNGVDMYETRTYNDITSGGSFMISNLIYVESAKELQITVRFNRSSVEKVQKLYNLSEKPTGEIYFFALDDGSDYYTDYSYVATKRFTYEYRRLVFSNVDLANTETLNLNIYYIDDVTPSAPLVFDPKEDYAERGVLTIYDKKLGWEDYNIKNALPAEVNGKLKSAHYVPFDD